MSTVPYAVGLTTESSDNYLFLVHGTDPKNAAANVVKLMGEELKYVWRCDVAADDLDAALEVKMLLCAIIEGMNE